jgi:hypothetical protein
VAWCVGHLNPTSSNSCFFNVLGACFVVPNQLAQV